MARYDMARLALLLLLSACASSAPTTYAQGAPLPPRPPAFNPATDSPITTGQPGYVGPLEGLPRSPYSRVLPQTPETMKEPGIWAAEGPPHVTPTMPLLFGIALPYPEVEDPIDRATTDVCAWLMQNAGTAIDSERGIWKIWGVTDRRCLSARLYEHCAQKMVDYYQAHVDAALAMDKGHERMVRLTLETAMAFRIRMCIQALPPAIERFFGRVRTEFDRVHENQTRETLSR